MPETATERNRRIFEEATAAGEPVFVVRAKDFYAPRAVLGYSLIVSSTDPDFDTALEALAYEMERWQAEHPEQVKEPDLR